MKNIKSMKDMRYLFLLLCIFSCYGSAITQEQKLNLMPVPEKVEISGEKFRISESFTIAVAGNPHKRIYPAATRFLKRLSARTGLFFTQGIISPASTDKKSAMAVIGQQPAQIRIFEDEAYNLEITSEKIIIDAITDLGALHAMETLLQLLSADSVGYYFPTVKISDKPRFVWRGLLIDVARHFIPLNVLKRNIDAMASVKMNVLHLHLTDDQGFRIESKEFPQLYLKGSDGMFYSQEQIKELINYADDRGILIVPEFNMPGHTSSWFIGYPGIASSPENTGIERTFGVKDAAMNPVRETTYRFINAFIKEMAALFPGNYIHIGGDEVTGKQWEKNKDIKKEMKAGKIADKHAMQQKFNTIVQKTVARYGKKMIGWDEILNPGLPEEVVIQTWRGEESIAEAVNSGFSVIRSNGYYIDLAKPAYTHYEVDPVGNNSFSEKEEKKILGGEATMWSELVSEETIDSRIWPRTAAIAERFWSPADITDVNEMYRRLQIVSLQLEEFGLTHIKNRDMMLRRLLNSNDISALKTLTDVIEPVKNYKRHSCGKEYTVFSPLTRIVDAARPDALPARDFNLLVESYLISPNQEIENEIRSKLGFWKSNHSRLLPQIKTSPVLYETEKLSENLSKISLIGIEALDFISKNEKPPEKWYEETIESLEKAKQPFAESLLMIVTPVEKIVKKSNIQ